MRVPFGRACRLEARTSKTFQDQEIPKLSFPVILKLQQIFQFWLRCGFRLAFFLKSTISTPHSHNCSLCEIIWKLVICIEFQSAVLKSSGFEAWFLLQRHQFEPKHNGVGHLHGQIYTEPHQTYSKDSLDNKHSKIDSLPTVAVVRQMDEATHPPTPHRVPQTSHTKKYLILTKIKRFLQ